MYSHDIYSNFLQSEGFSHLTINDTFLLIPNHPLLSYWHHLNGRRDNLPFRDAKIQKHS